jgi:hypothetical protein
MLNVFIINIEKNINKINNIIEKINDNPNINLMKVNPIFIEKKYKNIYFYCYHKLCDIFCNFKSNCYGITHIKLIENIYKNYNNDYTLIFENNIIPIDNNLYNHIQKIISICPNNWDIIKLYHTDNYNYNSKFNIFKKINKLEIFEKINNNNITNAYLINKKGKKKILEYKFKNNKNKKLKLNIYKSPTSIFEINKQTNKQTIYEYIHEYIYNIINLYFFDILFILLIILLIFMTFYNYQLFKKKL